MALRLVGQAGAGAIGVSLIGNRASLTAAISTFQSSKEVSVFFPGRCGRIYAGPAVRFQIVGLARYLREID